MGRRKHILGTCHLCGDYKKLSFEHVPPRSAFNDRPIVQATKEFLFKKEKDLDNIFGKTSQKGAGGYTLCEQCNNSTGAWYGSAFVEWTYQLGSVLLMAKGEPTLYYLYRIFPLRVIKQIVCMFFSTNGAQFRESHEDLVRFVLNKESRFIDPHIRIYCFFNPSDRSRQSGVAGILNIHTHTTKLMSEIVFPPMGYVMSFNEIKPDVRLFDITFFAKYCFNDWKELGLRLPSLPIYTHFPGDYRSRDKVLEDRNAKLKNVS